LDDSVDFGVPLIDDVGSHGEDWDIECTAEAPTPKRMLELDGSNIPEVSYGGIFVGVMVKFISSCLVENVVAEELVTVTGEGIGDNSSVCVSLVTSSLLGELCSIISCGMKNDVIADCCP